MEKANTRKKINMKDMATFMQNYVYIHAKNF